MDSSILNQKKYKFDKKEEMGITIFFLLIFLTVTIAIAFNQPLANCVGLYGNPPDEHAHYLVPMYIYEHGSLPTGYDPEVQIPGYGSSYAIYNVFPYIIMGLVMRFVALFNSEPLTLLLAARCVSIICGCIWVIFIRKIAREVFADDRVAMAFSALVIFMPQSFFVHTYVNTDSMCMMSIAIIVYALLRLYRLGIDLKCSIMLVVGVIICALSYYNAYGYILSAMILYLYYFYNDKKYDYKPMLKWGLPMAFVALLGISWWFIRNGILYDGDILGIDTGKRLQMEVAEALNVTSERMSYKDKGISIVSMVKDNDYLKKLSQSFVMCFGSMSIMTSKFVYMFYNAFFFIGLGTSVITVKSTLQNMKAREKVFHGLMIFCMVIPFFLLISYAYTYDYQYQGRYLLPALLPFAYYVINGINKILHCFKVDEKWVRLAMILITIILIVIGLYVTFHNAVPVYKTTGLVISNSKCGELTLLDDILMLHYNILECVQGLL